MEGFRWLIRDRHSFSSSNESQGITAFNSPKINFIASRNGGPSNDSFLNLIDNSVLSRYKIHGHYPSTRPPFSLGLKPSIYQIKEEASPGETEDGFPEPCQPDDSDVKVRSRSTETPQSGSDDSHGSSTIRVPFDRSSEITSSTDSGLFRASAPPRAPITWEDDGAEDEDGRRNSLTRDKKAYPGLSVMDWKTSCANGVHSKKAYSSNTMKKSVSYLDAKLYGQSYPSKCKDYSVEDYPKLAISEKNFIFDNTYVPEREEKTNAVSHHEDEDEEEEEEEDELEPSYPKLSVSENNFCFNNDFVAFRNEKSDEEEESERESVASDYPTLTVSVKDFRMDDDYVPDVLSVKNEVTNEGQVEPEIGEMAVAEMDSKKVEETKFSLEKHEKIGETSELANKSNESSNSNSETEPNLEDINHIDSNPKDTVDSNSEVSEISLLVQMNAENPVSTTASDIVDVDHSFDPDISIQTESTNEEKEEKIEVEKVQKTMDEVKAEVLSEKPCELSSRVNGQTGTDFECEETFDEAEVSLSKKELAVPNCDGQSLESNSHPIVHSSSPIPDSDSDPDLPVSSSLEPLESVMSMKFLSDDSIDSIVESFCACIDSHYHSHSVGKANVDCSSCKPKVEVDDDNHIFVKNPHVIGKDERVENGVDNDGSSDAIHTIVDRRQDLNVSDLPDSAEVLKKNDVMNSCVEITNLESNSTERVVSIIPMKDQRDEQVKVVPEVNDDIDHQLKANQIIRYLKGESKVVGRPLRPQEVCEAAWKAYKQIEGQDGNLRGFDSKNKCENDDLQYIDFLSIFSRANPDSGLELLDESHNRTRNESSLTQIPQVKDTLDHVIPGPVTENGHLRCDFHSHLCEKRSNLHGSTNSHSNANLANHVNHAGNIHGSQNHCISKHGNEGVKKNEKTHEFWSSKNGSKSFFPFKLHSKSKSISEANTDEKKKDVMDSLDTRHVSENIRRRSVEIARPVVNTHRFSSDDLELNRQKHRTKVHHPNNDPLPHLHLPIVNGNSNSNNMNNSDSHPTKFLSKAFSSFSKREHKEKTAKVWRP